jgi:glycosyltransferase involved in cell wall biosynthesis
MQQANPSISVVVPLYNHERFIEGALQSVYAQSVQPGQVIVVDDGSQDASLRIAQNFAASHSDTMIVCSHPNQGAHYTINAGIRQATGDIVAILNSDDLYSQNRFVECLPLFQANPNLSAVFTALTFINESGRPGFPRARARPFTRTDQRQFSDDHLEFDRTSGRV